MKSRRTALFVLTAGVVGLVGQPAARPAGRERTVYVAGLDAKGAPVTDLTAVDLTVKEGGKDQVITSLTPATGPMEIAILADDNGGGTFQAGVLQFMQTIGAHATFSIRRFNPQAAKVLDYTNDDVAAIQNALDQIGRRGKIEKDGEQLLSAISETIRELQQRNAPRRVMLVLTLTGEGQARNSDLVMKALQGSGIMMNVVCSNGANLGLLTGDGPRESGGRSAQAGSLSAIPLAITKITDTLLHQYALTYTLPDGVELSDRLSVSTTRKGISLLAPSHLPDK